MNLKKQRIIFVLHIVITRDEIMKYLFIGGERHEEFYEIDYDTTQWNFPETNKLSSEMIDLERGFQINDDGTISVSEICPSYTTHKIISYDKFQLYVNDKLHYYFSFRDLKQEESFRLFEEYLLKNGDNYSKKYSIILIDGFAFDFERISSNKILIREDISIFTMIDKKMSSYKHVVCLIENKEVIIVRAEIKPSPHDKNSMIIIEYLESVRI